MNIHQEPHPQAGETVKIKGGRFDGQDYRVEDWQDRVFGKSWQECDGNPACLEYALRAGMEGAPSDNNVVYGKIGFLGKIIHTSQLSI